MHLPSYYSSSGAGPSSSSILLPPSYTQRPNALEETIENTPSEPSYSGSFVKRTKDATIAIFNQEDDASLPVYGAHGDIRGEIVPRRRETVVSVDLKLEGSMSTMTTSGGRIVPILRQTHSLYRRSPRSTRGPPELCPSIVPFDLRMPLRFRHTELGRELHLPPTLRVSLREDKNTKSDLLYANVEYSLVLSIEHHVSLLGLKVAKSTESFRIPFSYLPRTRPSSPAIDRPLRRSLKCQPNEWCQISSRIQALDPAMGALDLDLFTPSIRVYPIGASIRFHLHAYGTLLAIRELHRLITAWHAGLAPVPMKVTLMRQWAVTPSSAKRTVHNVEISEAKSRPLPPSIDSEEPGMDGGTATIDWDGEIPLERAAVGETGSFDSGHLLAEDYVSVSFQPDPSLASKLSPHAFYYPIRLVSHPWIQSDVFDDDHEYLFSR